jgi:Bacterial Ig-like domain (group 3)/FG-GAP-like repeat
MRAKSNASLHWAAILTVGITLVSAPSGAQTVNKAAELEQLLSGSGIPVPAARLAVPRQHSTPAVQPRTKFETPFDRVMAPTLAKMRGVGKTTDAVPSARAAGTGVDGSNTNFPGFVATPFVTVNDGDPNLVYVSVSGDFNKDGVMDVAQVKRDGTIDVLLNPGTFAGIATMTPLVSPTSNNQVVIINVVAADMNGDGYPDLIGMDIYNNAIVVWLNKGDGTFAAATSYPVTLASGGVWFNGVDALGGGISVGDFNGDGAMDVVAISVNSYYIPQASKTLISEVTFVNNGTGQLIPLPEEDTTFPDYFLTNYGELAVFTNDGNKASGIALFLLSQNLNTTYEEDMVIATMASNGDGTFKPPVVPTANLVPDNGEFLYLNNSFVATNLSATAKASASNTIDPPGTPGSGVPTTDFVFMYGDGAVYDASYTTGNPTVGHLLVGVDTMAYLNGGVFDPPVPGPSSPPTLLGDPVPNQITLNVADMNGDGTPDLVVYSIGSAYIYPNAGKGVFSAAPTQIPGAYASDQEAQPANYDGSSYNSLITSDFLLSEMGYYQNRGVTSSNQAGQFVSAALVSGPNVDGNFEELGGNIDIIATADVNGDGIPDLIGIDKSIVSGGILDNIVVGFRNANGAVSQSSNYTFTTAITSQQLSPLFNSGYTFMQPLTIPSPKGGVSILLGGSNSGPLLVPLGKNGVAGTPVILPLGQNTLCSEDYGDVGDVNGDGIPDIVIAYTGDSSCYSAGNVPSGYFTLLGNADGSYQPSTFTPLGSELYAIRLINFTGVAGNLDLAAIDIGNYSVWVVPNKADGSGAFNVANATDLAKGYLVTDIIPGDYNSDGKQDLTLATIGQFTSVGISSSNYVPNTSGVLLMPGNGDYTFGTSTQINLAGAAPLWGAYADFNGDGTPDLALTVDSDSGTGEIGFAPMVQILPNLGEGTFGRAVVEMDGTSGAYGTSLGNSSINDDMYLLAGNFSNSGGTDLLISCAYGTSEFVNQGVTKLVLTASSTSVGQSSPVTLTATVSQVVSSGVAATGSVTFSDNGSELGIVETTSGVATLTTSLPVGSDAIVATYAGDSLHNQATAAPITVTVASVAPAFILTATPATLSLAQGATGTVLASLAGNSTFSGAVTVTCSGAPAETSCTASPANVTLAAGQSAAVSIVVATTPPNDTYQANGSNPTPRGMGPLSGLSLAGLAFVLWPSRRRRRSSLLMIFAAVTLALGAAGALTGCGSGKPTYPGTTAGTYTLTVTATSGGLTQTLPIALSVTQAQ